MKATFGYRCPVSGAVYRVNDTRLRGYGNPPSSPAAQTQFKGMGTFPMPRVLVPIDELPDEEKELLPENMIFEVEDNTPTEPTVETDA